MVPSTVAPSLKVTVPVGEAPVTVAVKVTGWPKLLGLAEEVMVVVVAAVTVMVAVAGPPAGASLDVTVLVVLTLVPVVVAVMLIEKVQLLFGVRLPPLKLIVLPPAEATTTPLLPPVQDPVTPVGLAFTRPAGSVS